MDHLVRAYSARPPRAVAPESVFTSGPGKSTFTARLQRFAQYSDRRNCPRGARAAPWDSFVCHYIVMRARLQNAVFLERIPQIASAQKLIAGAVLSRYLGGCQFDNLRNHSRR